MKRRLTTPDRKEDRTPAILQKLLERMETEEDTEIPEAQEPEQVLEVLVVQIGQERFGIALDHVQGIIRHVEATQVPHTVDFLEGIISLRGEMIPVISGRKRLGLPPKDADKKTRIVVLHEEDGRYGITVDATTQVLRLPKNRIEPTPPVVGLDVTFMEGVCEHKGQLIVILNLKRFLEFA